MIKKQFFKTKDTCKVTFELPKKMLPENVEVEKITLVGDFNDWNQQETPLRNLKKGSWKEQISLENDKKFAFRYLINDNIWLNDPEADGYESNGFNDQNFIVDTSKN